MFSGLNCGRGREALGVPLLTGGRRLEGVRAGDEGNAGEGTPAGDGTLEDVAEREHDYLESRLREELGREPTEEELNDWLRKHTEGY